MLIFETTKFAKCYIEPRFYDTSMIFNLSKNKYSVSYYNNINSDTTLSVNDTQVIQYSQLTLHSLHSLHAFKLTKLCSYCLSLGI